MAPDPVEIALILSRILEGLGVRYCVGGSVASSVYGEVRTTLDADLVAELRQEHLDALLAASRYVPNRDQRLNWHRRRMSSFTSFVVTAWVGACRTGSGGMSSAC